MTWVLVVAWIAVAAVTARVAVHRGHDRVLWLVLGLVFPVASLLALLLGWPRSHPEAGRLSSDVAAALHDSRVAHALATEGPLTPEQAGTATGLPEKAVDSELGALKLLGLVKRAGGGAWRLSPSAAAALASEAAPVGEPGPDEPAEEG